MIKRTAAVGRGTAGASLLPVELNADDRPVPQPGPFTAPRPWASTLIPVDAPAPKPRPRVSRTTVVEVRPYRARHARAGDLELVIDLSTADHTPR